MAAKSNKKKWYLRKEVWGAALTGVSSLLMLFPNFTTAYKIGAGIGIAVGTAKTVEGLKTGYESDNLPSGISKVMDAIPDSITGTRGIKSNK